MDLDYSGAMLLLFYYFLKCVNFFLVIFEFILTINLSKRIKSVYQDNIEIIDNKNERGSFIKWYGICSILPFIFLLIFQIMGKYNNFSYIFWLDFKNPFYIIGIITILFFWGLFLYILFFKNGAEFIEKYREAFRFVPSDKQKIKKYYVLLVLIGIIIIFFGGNVILKIFPDLYVWCMPWI